MTLTKTNKKDHYGRPIYLDDNGETYVDINLGQTPKPIIYSTTKEGEPLYPSNVTSCCRCDNIFYGHGHNAWPLMKGRCCSQCNLDVIVKRMEDMGTKVTRLGKKIFKSEM